MISKARLPDILLSIKHSFAVYVLFTVVWFSAALSGRAQTNTYVGPGDGYWDEPRLWSLAAAPSLSQSGIVITNAPSNVVTIDSVTSSLFTNTLTVSNLVVSGGESAEDSNKLFLNNAGTTRALHVLNELAIGYHFLFTLNFGSVILTNSALVVDGVLGGDLGDDGQMWLTDSSLVTTNCSLWVGRVNAVASLVASNCVIEARDLTIAEAESPGGSGAVEIDGGTISFSSVVVIATGGGAPIGTMLVSGGATCVVTNGGICVGGSDQGGSGMLTVTNATLLAENMTVGCGFRSPGNLVVDAGTVTVNDGLQVGEGASSASGNILIENGGFLAVTNGSTLLGYNLDYGMLTVSGGTFLGRDVAVGAIFESEGALILSSGVIVLNSNLVVGSTEPGGAYVSVSGGQLVVTNGSMMLSSGPAFLPTPPANLIVTNGQVLAKDIELGSPLSFGSSAGTINLSGGSVTVSASITLGDCATNSFGYLIQNGGQLFVTNASHNAFVDVRNGQLELDGGVLQVDKLVMTNTCSQFIHTGGTLIVGSVILDPNVFRITSVAREGNNLRVTWLMAPGQTNALQATSGGTQGSYTTNGFADIFIVTNNTTTGSLTNYLDVGAATNVPARFYRARLSP